MAKALLGYVGALPDRRLLDEVTYLRSRVRDLEAEVAKLRTDGESSELEKGLRQLSELPEPALADRLGPSRTVTLRARLQG